MEDKRLNLSQPLISVRRFPTVVGSKKDVKTKNKPSSPSVPLPPFYKSELKSGPVSNPGTVPFTWEKSPGRPKDERKPQSLEHPPIIPKLPPGRISEVKQQGNLSVSRREAGKTSSTTLSFPSTEEYVTNYEGSESGDSDEAYLDALDTLSRTETNFLSCSVSGLSGLDGPEAAPSGTFSTDAQTRDLMMGRFLPAAKAMTSEAPQHGMWKQPVKVQPRELRELISGNRQPPLNHSRPNNVQPYCSPDYEEEESADEDDEYDEPGNLSTKVCGLLPRFCVKGSVCILNPLPGTSVRTRVPMSSVKKNQASSSSAGSCQQTKYERMRVAIHEQRSIIGPQKTEMERKLEGSSLYMRLQGRGTSPWQNELTKSRFCEEGFPDILQEAQQRSIDPRKQYPLKQLLADNSLEMGTGSASSMVEKTVYVDSVHKAVSPKFKVLEATPSEDGILSNIEKSNIPHEDQDHCGESIADADVRLPRNGYMDYEDHQQQQFKKAENIENYKEIKSHCPAPPPPPPPKSPSESWLWRTLPSISTKNSPSLSFLTMKVSSPLHASKTSSVDPKWETVVKTKKDLITAAPKI